MITILVKLPKFPVTTIGAKFTEQLSVDEDRKVSHLVVLDEGEKIRMASVDLLRRESSGRVQRRLEELVNADVIGLAGAQKIFLEVFGIRLKGVPIKRSARIPTRFRAKSGKL